MASTEQQKPTPSEPEATSNLAKSFEDRLSFPSDSSKSKATNGTNPSASNFTPSKFDWADDVTTPVEQSDSKAGDKAESSSKTESKAPADGEGKSGTDMAQNDGANPWMGGSSMLDEPAFDVNVKLADLQDDPNNPLYSVKTFEELNL